MGAMHELTPEMLARFTQIDYDREMALLATIEEQGKPVQQGVARYMINPDGRAASSPSSWPTTCSTRASAPA